MKTVFLTVVLLSVAGTAEAYKLYHTKSGKNVRWATSYVEVVLDESMAILGEKDEVTEVLAQAFELWAMDADLPLTFDLVWDECGEVGNDGNNCIFACPDRSVCYGRPEEKGGTTYVSVNPSSGRITDADIVLNADTWEWDIDGTNEEGLCLGRVMSHEIGHFLGIDHSEEPDALMYPILSRDAEVAESLHFDDREAAVTLYENFVEMDENAGANCAVANVGKSGVDAGYWALLMVGLFAALRIRRRGR
jgi:MYXO-CTERM domain-containing protein